MVGEARMVFAACAVTATLAAPASARADLGKDNADGRWRDGCPSYYLPAPRASSFTRSGDPDTLLGMSRVELTTTWSRFPSTSTRPRTAMVSEQLHLHLQLAGGPLVAVGVSAVQPTAVTGLASASRFRLANLNAAVGYRHAGFWMGDAIRHGLGIKLGVGASPWTDVLEDPGEIADLDHFADYMPFRTYLAAHDRPITTTVEGRVELIGCQGPYARFRADAVTWRDPTTELSRDDANQLWVFPITLAAGGYAWEGVLVEVSVGVELRAHRDRGPEDQPDDPPPFDLDRTSRFRLYVEYEPPAAGYRAHVGFVFDALRGARDGWQAGVTFACDLFGKDAAGGILE